jgi:hypothetical protein
MASPLKTYDGELIGVLCVESPHPDSFSSGLLADFTAATAELAPHVLVLKSQGMANMRSCPWHPRIHGWDFARVLRRVCHSLAQTIEDDGVDGIEVAIWSVDRVHGELNVYATSGEAVEFVREQSLDMNSFTGFVAQSPARSVGRVRPRDRSSTIVIPTADGTETREGTPFRVPYPRKSMGLTEAISAPVHLPDSSGAAGEARYVLGIYAYGDDAVRALPSHDELTRIAETIGEVLSAYIEQRSRLAVTYLVQSLAATSRRRGSIAATLMNELSAFLHLEAVRIYLGTGIDDELIAIKKNGKSRALHYGDGNWEYLRAVLAHPGIPVRINNDRSRPPAFLSRASMRGAAGWFPWFDPDHRRFMDIGLEGGSVIRLIRSEQSKPFTADDELVFGRLAGTCNSALRPIVAAHHRQVVMR